MTAGNSFVLWNSSICLTTWVDCASAGSQATASLLRTSWSLPAGLKARARIASQNTTTNHFVTLDDGNRANRPTSPICVCAIARFLPGLRRPCMRPSAAFRTARTDSVWVRVRRAPLSPPPMPRESGRRRCLRGETSNFAPGTPANPTLGRPGGRVLCEAMNGVCAAGYIRAVPLVRDN